jgi:hypothetical protein
MKKIDKLHKLPTTKLNYINHIINKLNQQSINQSINQKKERSCLK